jgi:hypothetical protein
MIPLSSMKTVCLFSAKHAAMNRLSAHLEHGVHNGRCLWRNGHQRRWIERLGMRTALFSDSRQDRLFKRLFGR